MKRLISLMLAILLFVAFSNAQNDAGWVSKSYEIDNFSELHLEGGYKVFLSQGARPGLLVKTTGSDVFDVLKIRQNGDLLHLDVERDNFDFDRINLYITFTQLENLHIEGGVSLKTEGYLDLGDFDLWVEGGAKIDLDLKADNIKIRGEGGVLFSLDGVANSLDVYVTGAAHVDAEDLKTKDVVFRIEGVGTGSVFATRSLDAKIEGVGKIRYKGNPQVKQYIDGLGSVKGE